MVPKTDQSPKTGHFRKTDHNSENGSITTTGHFRKTDQFRKRIKSPTDQPSTTDQLMLSISSLTKHLSSKRRFFVRLAIDNAWYSPRSPRPTVLQLFPSSSKERERLRWLISFACSAYPLIDEEEEGEADGWSCIDWSNGCTGKRKRRKGEGKIGTNRSYLPSRQTIVKWESPAERHGYLYCSREH